jgi:hypothetical protein
MEFACGNELFVFGVHAKHAHAKPSQLHRVPAIFNDPDPPDKTFEAHQMLIVYFHDQYLEAKR